MMIFQQSKQVRWWVSLALLGNALFEEVIFHGFLLPQCFFLVRGLTSRPRTRPLVALLVSQLLFAFYHIPLRLSNNVLGVILFYVFATLVLLFWPLFTKRRAIALPVHK